MSAAILDRARAFDILSPLLTEVQRSEIAKALGDRLLAEIKPAPSSPPRTPAETLPDPERLKFDGTAQWLSEHGFSSADLVKAAGRLEEFLKKHPTLTREAGQRVWLTREVGMSR